MSLGYNQEKFMSNLAKLIMFAESKGFRVRGKELQRTIEQQKNYVEKGLSKTMQSKHIDCCAIDLFFTKSGVLYGLKREDKFILQEIGDYWTDLDVDNKWGGNWESFLDLPHFEG